jgi:integrase/recombinase XerD
LPAKLSTILKKLESVSEANQIILKNFYDYMRSKNLKSDHHIINLLVLLISLDKFFGPDIPFTSINSREQILTFLEHQYSQKDDKWVKRRHDAEGRYITSFNQNKRLLSVFFRWLFNSNRDDDHEGWETPPFLKIKTKKPLRESPYDINDIWELDDVLTIVSYEPELRNQAIITLLWDLDARPHEITALRIKDIVLNEQYGEGAIPSNTKTGGGPILLTSSFTYIRDMINKHPFKNEPNARLIYSLVNGAPITSQTIWQVLKRLRLLIKRLVESGSITDEQQKQKLEHLLRVKKWNPYCFRHSAITDDSDHLPEYALKKKVRWVMGSNQPKRYIKNRMGDELKNKILERHGIKIATFAKQMVSRTCGRCGYVNKLESKYCEGKGCNYPLTQLALEDIKAAERAKLQELVKEDRERNDQVIYELKQQMAQSKQEIKDQFQAYEAKMNEFVHDIQSRAYSEEREQSARDFVNDKMTEILDRTAPGWFEEVYGPGAPAHRLTPKGQEKIQQLLKEVTPLIEAENRQRDLELQRQRKILMNTLEQDLNSRA